MILMWKETNNRIKKIPRRLYWVNRWLFARFWCTLHATWMWQTEKFVQSASKWNILLFLTWSKLHMQTYSKHLETLQYITEENPQLHQLNNPKLKTDRKKEKTQTCPRCDNSNAVGFLPLLSLFEYSGSVLKRSCQPVSKQMHLSAVKSARRSRTPGRTARSLSPPAEL